eukprot:m.50336 g.50336  ORF g.50336 m.50336 type:complete len:779 (+) comp10663_c0_seq3:272-2608(+)
MSAIPELPPPNQLSAVPTKIVVPEKEPEKPKVVVPDVLAPADFGHEALLKASAQLLLLHGFHESEESALHLVSEMIELYIEQICRVLSDHAHHYGRHEGNLDDFGQALTMLGSPTMEGFRAFLDAGEMIKYKIPSLSVPPFPISQTQIMKRKVDYESDDILEAHLPPLPPKELLIQDRKRKKTEETKEKDQGIHMFPHENPTTPDNNATDGLRDHHLGLIVPENDHRDLRVPAPPRKKPMKEDMRIVLNSKDRTGAQRSQIQIRLPAPIREEDERRQSLVTSFGPSSKKTTSTKGKAKKGHDSKGKVKKESITLSLKEKPKGRVKQEEAITVSWKDPAKEPITLNVKEEGSKVKKESNKSDAKEQQSKSDSKTQSKKEESITFKIPKPAPKPEMEEATVVNSTPPEAHVHKHSSDKEKKKKKKDKKEKKKKHRDKEQSLGIPSLKLKLSIPIDKVSDGASEAVVIKTISDEPQPKPKVEESKSPSKANSQESKVKVEPTLATSGNVKGKKTKKETSKKSGTTPSKKKANVKDPPEGIVTPSPQGNPQVLATPALLHKLSWRPTEDRLRAVLPPKRTKRALLKPKEKDSDFYCVCGLGETDDAGNYIDMVQCNDCEVWYHFNCVGLDTTTFDKEEWRCPDCLVDTKAGDVIDHPLTSDMQQGLIKILNSVRKEKGSKEFEVAPTDSIAPHYSFYIFEPCDFQTVHKRLNEGKWYPRENKYPCIRAFDRDMQLIFDNCVCYNQNTDEESTRLRRLAESVGKAYNKKIENFLAKLREESIS